MWPFRKKKIFQITWSFDSLSRYSFTEIVRAVDIAHAWNKISKKHYLAITLVKWTEVR